MRRYLADVIGNYLFFVPLVIGLTPALWSGGWQQYLLAAIPISLIGARCYTLFLKHLWYPFMGVKF